MSRSNIDIRLIILIPGLTWGPTSLHQSKPRKNRYKAYNRSMLSQELAPCFGRFANLAVSGHANFTLSNKAGASSLYCLTHRS
jgi:hypothetical protein